MEEIKEPTEPTIDNIEIEAKECISNITVKVNVTGLKIALLRLQISLLCFRLGALIGGVGLKVVENTNDMVCNTHCGHKACRLIHSTGNKPYACPFNPLDDKIDWKIDNG